MEKTYRPKPFPSFYIAIATHLPLPLFAAPELAGASAPSRRLSSGLLRNRRCQQHHRNWRNWTAGASPLASPTYSLENWRNWNEISDDFGELTDPSREAMADLASWSVLMVTCPHPLLTPVSAFLETLISAQKELNWVIRRLKSSVVIWGITFVEQVENNFGEIEEVNNFAYTSLGISFRQGFEEIEI